ncbi:hypothetical protein A1OO_21040 [Enterovibrio norvegicus FF-33]|uniref:UPF0319 protein A1OK_21495 n=2 Tax=Enterovibrio TaxID=188143 RepID=A0A1E5C649_9GAMM|nr:DUF2057 domain-containing protein [Enterovibrio norvegicus]OEE60988.1 hypothetical protein A1OK_21495 [Enterovibrio norvegicus FF-454]OEE68214.1 hypothetical protein A1OO_21040 [Enterovibrio norvegicus FF-33]OEE74972.1 hypothetical protein A1OQ_08085 [Enterovibrio norvegicus FF-162]
MFKRTVIAAGVLATSSVAFADVTIDIPSGVQVLVENGIDSDYSNLGFDNQDKVVLPNGESQILFRLSHIVRESGSKKTKYKSVPLVATFTAADAALTLKLPRIDTLDDGRMFDKKPSFTLSENGKPIDIKQDKLSIGFELMPDYVKEIEKYNRANNIASWQSTGAVATVAATIPVVSSTSNAEVSKVTSASVSPDAGVDTEQMLKFWFAQADSESQKAFLSWAIQNVK